MRKKMVILIIVGVFLTIGISGSATAQDTIKMGVAGPHSGDLASYGIPTIHAAELVVKDINAKGGVLGKKVELCWAKKSSCWLKTMSASPRLPLTLPPSWYRKR